MPAPLSGIRVIDLGHYVAGPLASVMLGDQGADVIRIDRPGTPTRSSDAFYHRGKRRISLDLAEPADRDTALGLLAGADVLVENFRPGVLERLGLGPDVLREQFPRLIVLSLPGFGPDDPRHDVRAWEGVVDAATSNTRIRAGEEHPDWPGPDVPTYSAVPIASNFAAFLGVTGVVAALTERRRSGRGQHVTVPLFDAMFEVIGDAGAYVTADGGPKPQRPLDSNGSGTYACADGRYVQFNPIGATLRFLTWLLQAAGRPEWVGETDADVVRGRLTELFATRPAQEWEDLGRAAGVPLALIRTSEEWLHTPHAVESGAVVRLDDPLLGSTLVPGPAVYSGRGAADDTPAPRPRRLPDADREEILRELAGARPEPAEPTGSWTSTGLIRTRPLSGLCVLDLTQILAGPSSARILGELGADVIKINAPQRRVAAHGVVNRGKESILLDIESEAGQEVFWRLLDTADVVIQNFPTGTAERYGIGYADVSARRADVVYISVSCYGGTGPWAAGRGYETQAQAVSGIMARSGGSAGRPTVLGPYNLLDYGTGVLAAYAAVLGVHQRAVTGSGLALRTSLVQTASHHQAAFLVDHPGASHGTEPTGPDARGAGPLQRFYRAADRWLYLHVGPGDRLDLVDGFGEVGHLLTGAPGDPAKVEAALTDLFARRPAREWVAALVAAGIGAHEVLEFAELMVDPVVRERGLSITQQTVEVGEVTMPGLAIGMSATPPQVGTPAGRPGSDAAKVLEGVGLGGSLAELERKWVVQTRDLPPGWAS